MAHHGDGYPDYLYETPTAAAGPYNALRINANVPPMPAPPTRAEIQDTKALLEEALMETASSF